LIEGAGEQSSDEAQIHTIYLVGFNPGSEAEQGRRNCKDDDHRFRIIA
jgi:hypothetical protein